MTNAILTQLATTSVSGTVMQAYITPMMTWICGLASLVAVFFLVIGGIRYTTSTGHPEKLEEAKKIVKNAIIGLAIVIASASLVAILSHAYAGSGNAVADQLPDLQAIQPKEGGGGFGEAVINGVTGLLRNIVQSVAEPFLNALGYFINSTPLMGDNPNVFNLWLAVVGIADALFVLVVALLGFHIMSFSSLGFDEIDLKSLLPRLILGFILINTSIFIIDGIIALSNVMINALQSGFVSTDIWGVLVHISEKSADLGVAALLVMVAFLILVIMLLVYYVGRLISLYIGAILSPAVLLLWLIPAFKDFALTALKTYLALIFVLFVHAIIFLLAASLFTAMLHGNSNQQPNTLMALIVGIATVMALLKTQGFMQELSYAASAPRAAREMAGSFNRGISSMRNTAKAPVDLAKGGYKRASQMDDKRAVRKEKKEQKVIAKRISETRVPGGTTTPLKTGETRSAVGVERRKS